MKYLFFGAIGLIIPILSSATMYYAREQGGPVHGRNAQVSYLTPLALASDGAIDQNLREPDMQILTPQPVTGEMHTYYYVNVYGLTATVEAPNALSALLIPKDRASNSGVVLADNLMQTGMVVRSVAQ